MILWYFCGLGNRYRDHKGMPVPQFSFLPLALGNERRWTVLTPHPCYTEPTARAPVVKQSRWKKRDFFHLHTPIICVQKKKTTIDPLPCLLLPYETLRNEKVHKKLKCKCTIAGISLTFWNMKHSEMFWNINILSTNIHTNTVYKLLTDKKGSHTSGQGKRKRKELIPHY